jgi:hypothetical protein
MDRYQVAKYVIFVTYHPFTIVSNSDILVGNIVI